MSTQKNTWTKYQNRKNKHSQGQKATFCHQCIKCFRKPGYDYNVTNRQVAINKPLRSVTLAS